MIEDKQDKIEELNNQIEEHKAALLKIRKVISLVASLVIFWTIITPIYRGDNKIV